MNPKSTSSRRPFLLEWWIAACLWTSVPLLASEDPPSAKAKPDVSHDPVRPAAPSRAAPLNTVSTNTTPLLTAVEDSLRSQFEPPTVLPSELTASGNLIPKSAKVYSADELRPWRTQVDGALRLRSEKNLAAAENTLIGVLYSNSPLEIQRECLKHLAQFAIDARQYSRAQQIYSQYVNRFPGDPETPEILFRQGMLYRQMGAEALALSKFYAVMSTAISIAEVQLPRYRSLVLLAQTEIADTYYLQGKFSDSADYFRKVLKLDQAELNEPLIRYKLVKSLAALERHTDVIAEGQMFLSKCPTAAELPEVRFLLSDSYRRLGRGREALDQTLALLTAGKAGAEKDPAAWAYWQQRTGNDLANQLYREGDYLSALQVYETLSKLRDTPEWQLPAWYQMGLVFERLGQPRKSADLYRRILDRQKEVPTPSPGLTLVFEMAKWRSENISWTDLAEKDTASAIQGVAPTETGNGNEPENVSLIRPKK
jgi:tetratricopeptide (TPR) repeat protein